MILRTVRCWLAERHGSGDGEGWTLQTRQIAFEPLPASVLFALEYPVIWREVLFIGVESTLFGLPYSQ